MIPQVIDAMGDKRDCQRQHLFRKLPALKPEWLGFEISNTTPLPRAIYVNEVLCQIVFLLGGSLRNHLMIWSCRIAG
jgi:hypothetical protein